MNTLRRNRFFSFFSAAALLLFMLLPFFAVYQVPSEAKQMASLFGEKILLCTSEGFKFVSWADIVSGKEKPKPHHEYRCPLCYVASHGQLLTPPAFLQFFAAATFLLLVHVSFAVAPIAAELAWRRSLTRSPPSLVG